MATIIRIAAAAIMRADGRMLVVRKRGTAFFMQPGGKIEPGEDPLAALRRELAEEVGPGIVADFDGEKPVFLGHLVAAAANEPDHVVEADLFLMTATEEAVIAAEIAEARWISREEAAFLPLAALTRDKVMPLIWR